MASLAAGRRVGTAKAANIIPVKCLEGIDGSYHSTHIIFQGLQWILSDRGGKDKASIINISFGSKGYIGLNPYYVTNLQDPDPFSHFLPLLAQRGVVAVCAVGNNSPEGVSDDKLKSRGHLPPLYAMPESVAADTLIVVGATDNQGRVRSQSNKFTSVITAYAPGAELTLLSFENQLKWMSGGTSAATALTSGLIATFLARPDLETELGLQGGGSLLNTVKLVKTFVKKAAQYATDPDKGDVHVIGTYNYVPCDDEAHETHPLNNTNPERPVVWQIQTKQVYKVPNAQCVGASPEDSKIKTQRLGRHGDERRCHGAGVHRSCGPSQLSKTEEQN